MQARIHFKEVLNDSGLFEDCPACEERIFLEQIAKTCDCKWETVQRTIGKCTEVWGSLDQMPGGITSTDIDWMINSRSSSDEGYLPPDCDEVLARCR